MPPRTRLRHAGRVNRALTAERVRGDVEVVARAGLDLETFLSESLASIARAVPHVAACVGTVDPASLLLTGTLKFGDLHGRDEHDHEWGLLEYGGHEETAFTELAHRAVPAVAVRETDADSVRLNEFMVPRYDYADELRLVMRGRGQVWGCVALFRGPTDRPFGAEEVALLASLSETMSVGMRLGLLTRLTEAPDMTHRGPAVVVVGPDDQISSMSVGAEERLAELKFNAHQTEPTGIVASLVGSARRFARGEVAHAPSTRVRARSGMWLVMHASPMAGLRGTSDGDVVITIDEARPPEIVPLVVAAFDLTDREREVTEKVLRGLDTREIAGALHLSTYTVQDHLKSVFEKASVRSRRELVSRVYFDQYVPRMGTEVGPSGWYA